MPTTAAKKLQIFVDVVDKPDVHVGVYSSPPGLNENGVDHILVTLNKDNEAVVKALEDGDRDEIMRRLNFGRRKRWTSYRVFSTSAISPVRF